MGDPREDLGLAREARLVALAVDDLERDDAAGQAILRAVDAAHPAGAGEALDLESVGDDDAGAHSPSVAVARLS